MLNILITGCAGFIGSHLTERLLKEGHTVFGVDNLLTGRRENIKRLEKIAATTKAEFLFLEYNIQNESIEKLLSEKCDDLDQIYHLACPASPKDFSTLGVEILEVCAKGTMNMLKLARLKKARFLFTSTSEVYGDPLKTPQTEYCLGNVNVLGPRSCYDEGKRFAESYTVHFATKYNIDFRIARVFNTYGPRMRRDDGRVIPNFIEQLRNGAPITIYGEGDQTRSFCYVDDMVDGLIALMSYEKLHENIREEDPVKRVFNLGNPQEIKIVELAKLLAKIMGEELHLAVLPLPKDDPKRRCPQITKATEAFGFEPKVPLKEGLKRTLEGLDEI